MINGVVIYPKQMYAYMINHGDSIMDAQVAGVLIIFLAVLYVGYRLVGENEE